MEDLRLGSVDGHRRWRDGDTTGDLEVEMVSFNVRCVLTSPVTYG